MCQIEAQTCIILLKIQTLSKEVKNLKTQEQVKSKKTSILWLIGVFIIAVGLLLFCQFYFGDSISDKTTFYQNTYVNGVNISGMTKAEAEDALSEDLIENKDKIRLVLKNEDKTWQLNGTDFEVVGNFEGALDNILEYGHQGNIFQKKKVEKKIKEDGLIVSLPYQDLLGGLDGRIDEIIDEIEREPQSAVVVFKPNESEMFSLSESYAGIKVDRMALEDAINEAILSHEDYVINIPFQEITPEQNLDDYINSIALRSTFATNYAKSSDNRKANIKLALSKFNGMIVEPGEEISFNKTTGPRTSKNGYKDAKIIFNGSYVSGIGGGVCQASTTLYNALIRGDIEVIEAHHHSLPASYVPLSFDAMVSEGYADLVFVNNLDTPIYIKAYGTDSEAIVEIYGEPLDDGLEIRTRSELVKVIAHGGDKIVTDSEGKYSDKVLYKGEYYRLKYPQEGYESKGYLQYYKNGELTEEKEIRHDHYQPQNGVIVEGSATLEEGMTLPASNVKYISPQKVTKETTENAKRRFNII